MNILLNDLYILLTEPRWKQIPSEVASVIVMNPSACLGRIIRMILEVSGKMTPPMKKWMEEMDKQR